MPQTEHPYVQERLNTCLIFRTLFAINPMFVCRKYTKYMCNLQNIMCNKSKVRINV